MISPKSAYCACKKGCHSRTQTALCSQMNKLLWIQSPQQNRGGRVTLQVNTVAETGVKKVVKRKDSINQLTKKKLF
jgi:hypothetical protein